MQVVKSDTVPVPRHAVLLYEGGSQSFATVHPVEIENDVPVIRPGIAATRRGLNEAMQMLAQKKLKPELLRECILAKGSDHLVWYRPPSRQTIWVRSAELGGDIQAEVPTPGVIWVVHTGYRSVKVFAYKDEGRPDGTTELHQAPFFNVWQSGEICIGSAEAPKGAAALVPENWEAMFFGSWFSHPNTGKLVTGKQSAYAFWKDLLAGKYRKFPQAKLVPLKRTLEQEFEAMFNGRKRR